ncbi:MAG: hypothetical protein Q9195_007465 [Heterodermia aff. obscurata]
MADENHRKRRKTNEGEPFSSPVDGPSRRSISPPPRRTPRKAQPVAKPGDALPKEVLPTSSKSGRLIPSPIQLNNIPELPASSNVDTVSLRDILGDPLISECWLFNYLFDVDFLLSQFDEDVRELIQIKLVHGSWKRDDTNKIRIDEAVKRHSNIQSITAHMPEAFGTHHSKMIVLFRHDDQAQVNLLTANFIDIDWRMSQAVWRSPLLPLQAVRSGGSSPVSKPPLPPIGSGARFKRDLLAYFRCYIGLRALTRKLDLYDFASVRGALVASLPGRRGMDVTSEEQNLWGLPGLERVLENIPRASKPIAPYIIEKSPYLPTATPAPKPSNPQIVIQISSVATIGDKWLRDHLFPSLSTIAPDPTPNPPPLPPRFHIIFPTPDEIRRSVDGYASGSSIHMRNKSPTQSRQLAYLRPLLRHWAGDQDGPPTSTEAQPIREAGRRRAAPHIKTYIRFSDASMTRIDWAMLTSANLSNQAWGSETKEGLWRVCSYEVGVVVWPGLWGGGVEMVPVFKGEGGRVGGQGEEGEGDGVRKGDEGEGIREGVEGEGITEGEEGEGIKVAWRMPYDLPLVPYRGGEMPWIASEPCEERDWMGRSWAGFGDR